MRLIIKKRIMQSSNVLVSVEDLRVHFPIHRGLLQRMVGVVKAVDGISFEILRGETLALVGESGCGKSTTGQAILQLIEVTSGNIYFNGKDLTQLTGSELKTLRPRMQIIFQDPYESLNPKMTVEQLICEPLVVNRIGTKNKRKERVSYLLRSVGLNPGYMKRFPHEFSGGQRQRIGIARALALNPDLIVADEPISALDVSVQAQIVNLLQDLQEEHGIAYLAIFHDLSMVQHIADRVAVMYLGKLMELSSCDTVFNGCLHPYTKALISAAPVPNPKVEAAREQIVLVGEVPSPAGPPLGCPFNTRCPIVHDICFDSRPGWREVRDSHFVACHFVE